MMHLLLALSVPGLHAEELPSASELLTQVDRNMTFETRSLQATMEVVKPKRTKTYTLTSYGRGVDEAASEFLSPARDAGTKMLKRGEELWMYLPSIEKVQKLSGHMLRQGMMGSDVSYEDMMESSSWLTNYTATVTGTGEFESQACWTLELTAIQDDVSYPVRKVWVAQDSLVPVKQELYALSGMLIKVWTMHDVQEIEGRYYPMRMRIEDKLQQDTYTEMRFSEVSFSLPLEEEIFSQRWLER
jgi:outer membrane lipoprotein-sorting protein